MLCTLNTAKRERGVDVFVHACAFPSTKRRCFSRRIRMTRAMLSAGGPQSVSNDGDYALKFIWRVGRRHCTGITAVTVFNVFTFRESFAKAASSPTNQWGMREYVIVHTIWGCSPVILWISLGGKPKWIEIWIP